MSIGVYPILSPAPRISIHPTVEPSRRNERGEEIVRFLTAAEGHTHKEIFGYLQDQSFETTLKYHTAALPKELSDLRHTNYMFGREHADAKSNLTIYANIVIGLTNVVCQHQNWEGLERIGVYQKIKAETEESMQQMKGVALFWHVSEVLKEYFGEREEDFDKIKRYNSETLPLSLLHTDHATVAISMTMREMSQPDADIASCLEVGSTLAYALGTELNGTVFSREKLDTTLLDAILGGSDKGKTISKEALERAVSFLKDSLDVKESIGGESNP